MEQFDDLIFKYFKPDENSSLSSLKGLDLQEFICLLYQVNIGYRNNLGIDDNYTFGVEIEMEDIISSECVEKNVSDLFLNGKWVVDNDGTLTNGKEVRSPILRDNYYCWEDLRKVCNKLKYLGSIGDHCGGHVHTGAHSLGSDMESWINFLKLWSTYENIIYRFGYGEFFGPRPIILDYAKDISNDIWFELFLSGHKFKSVLDLKLYLGVDEAQAINFDNINAKNPDKFCEKNTVEIRCFNGTLNPIIWQNLINLPLKMMMYAIRFDFNHDIINRRHKKIYYKSDSFESYSQVFLNQALEFCDLIFNNNLDKIYFLRQYLKTTEVFPKENPFTRTRKFTK